MIDLKKLQHMQERFGAWMSVGDHRSRRSQYCLRIWRRINALLAAHEGVAPQFRALAADRLKAEAAWATYCAMDNATRNAGLEEAA